MGGRSSTGGNSSTPSEKVPNITGAKTQKELNQKLADKGLSLDSAYQRASSGEEVVMYKLDKKGNVRNRYVGTYNQYSDGGREIINIHSQPLVNEIQIGDRTWRVNSDGSQTEITKRRTK